MLSIIGSYIVIHDASATSERRPYKPPLACCSCVYFSLRYAQATEAATAAPRGKTSSSTQYLG